MNRLLLALFSATLVFAQPSPAPDFTPPTPLFRAVAARDMKAAKQLLDAGADPNEGRFLGAPPLSLSLMQQDAAMAALLLQKGASVKASDPAGNTALMWAAAMEVPDPSIVAELIRRGADVNAANLAGDTALTWAMRRGYTPTLELLKKHGASDQKMIRDAVQRSVALMQKSGPEFVKVSGCTSCHNQSLPQMAWSMARERGMQVDPQISDKQAKSVIALFKPIREVLLKGTEMIPNPAISVSYLLVGLAAEGYQPDETTAAMAHLVSLQQNADGSFRAFRARPPIESSEISAAALSIRALQAYGTGSADQVDRAAAWLRTAAPRTNEEKVMKLLGLAWAKASADDLRAAAQPLLADQHPDGGWAQLPQLETDAYATGQALYALHTAGQIAVTDAVYGRGSAFLLRTQRPDGSWLVRSRSFPFQPYKESGFPHGKDQWISAAGSGWAAMALMVAVPPADQHVSKVF